MQILMGKHRHIRKHKKHQCNKIAVLITFIFLFSCYNSFGQQPGKYLSVKNIPSSENIERPLVACHRGYWTREPENSIAALEASIRIGADFVEADVRRTKDGHFIILHDQRLDRTTNGKGKVRNYTLEQIQKFHLTDQSGVVTTHRIPTLENFLTCVKGRILVNLDKTFEYLPEVVAIIKDLDMEDQVIFSVARNFSYNDLKKKFGEIDRSIHLMPVVDIDKKNYRKIVSSFLEQRPTAIVQVIFRDDHKINLNYLENLSSNVKHIWINSMWSHLCGHHDDERAIKNFDYLNSWDWLQKHSKASILQTDYPSNMINYYR